MSFHEKPQWVLTTVKLGKLQKKGTGCNPNLYVIYGKDIRFRIDYVVADSQEK